MIYEIGTYTLTPRSVPEFEKTWGAAYPIRAKYSPIVAFLHTEFGPLNEVIHIWPYEDLAERARIRAEANAEPGWPPATSHLIVNQRVEVVTPFPFAPGWQPGKNGPVYELRQYTFRGGTLPQVMKGWEEALPERMSFSRPSLIGNVEFGPTVNSFIHIWSYESLEHRNEVRAKAAATGHWPPAGGENYISQANKLLLPAAFSPSQ